MTNRTIIEMLLSTAGMELKNYEMTRESDQRCYEGDGYRDGNCEVEFASDSIEGVVCEIMEQIYNTKDVKFNNVNFK
jgi:hypothetical protein